MNKNPLTLCRLPGGKSWMAAALILLQFACSANNDPALEYDADSSLNPSGPAAPDNTPLTPPDPRNPLNWYSNGDGESGVSPWYAQSGGGAVLSQSAVQARSGDHSLLINGRTEAWNAPVMPVLNKLPAGRYEASVWIRLVAGTDPTTATFSLKTKVAGVTDPIYTNLASAQATASGWTRLSATFDHAPAGQVEELALYVETQSPTASYYLDDLTLSPLGNLISNGGVEDGVSPWGYQGGGVMISQASEQARTGNYSLLVTGRTATWNGPLMNLPPLSFGRSYQASVWVRLAAGTPDTMLRLTLKRTVAGETAYIPAGEATVGDDAWTQLTGAFVHDVDGPTEELLLYIESSEAGASASFYVDDLEVGLPTQMAINGDVESSLSGWGSFGANVMLQRTDTDAYSGTYSVLVTNREADWQGATFGVAALTAGDQYTFSCWVKMAPENPDATLSMTVKMVDASGENYLPVVSSPVTTASWVQLTGAYFHDPDGAITEFTPYIQASVPTAEYLIDACAVTPQ